MRKKRLENILLLFPVYMLCFTGLNLYFWLDYGDILNLGTGPIVKRTPANKLLGVGVYTNKDQGIYMPAHVPDGIENWTAATVVVYRNGDYG